METSYLLSLVSAAIVFIIVKKLSRKPLPAYTTPPLVTSDKFLVPVAVDFGKNPAKFLQEARKKYGDVFTVDLMIRKLTFIISPDLNHKFFSWSNDEINFEEGIIQFVGHLFGQDMYDNKDWGKVAPTVIRRGLMSSNHLNFFLVYIKEELDKTLNKWQRMDKIDLFLELSNFVLLTDIRVLLGQEMYDKYGPELVHNFRTMEFDGVHSSSMMAPWLPFGKPASYRRARDFLFTTVGNYIEKIAKDTEKLQAEPRDYLTYVLANYGIGYAGLTTRILTTHVVSILFAAHVNTMTILAWTILHVLQQPAIMEKLMKEINSNDLNAMDPMEVLNNFPYIRACTWEAGRLYANLFMIRKAIKDVNIGKYTIPAGNSVVFSQHALVNAPDVVNAPTDFNPDRQLNEDNIKQHFFLFGAGKHPCLGQRFADLILVHFIYKLFKNYNVHLQNKEFPQADWTKNVGTPWSQGASYITITPKK